MGIHAPVERLADMKYFLAFLFLITPAHAGGKTEILKTESCVAGAAVKVIETQPSILVVQRVVMAWVKAKRARRLATPCEMPRRIRSPKDLRCYLPGREP
jgi:hypothetical protein